jgi:hypothetical protein
MNFSHFNAKHMEDHVLYWKGRSGDSSHVQIVWVYDEYNARLWPNFNANAFTTLFSWCIFIHPWTRACGFILISSWSSHLVLVHITTIHAQNFQSFHNAPYQRVDTLWQTFGGTSMKLQYMSHKTKKWTYFQNPFKWLMNFIKFDITLK